MNSSVRRKRSQYYSASYAA
nr:putative integron gene cassette protein [uncultured bacterium]